MLPLSPSQTARSPKKCRSTWESALSTAAGCKYSISQGTPSSFASRTSCSRTRRLSRNSSRSLSSPSSVTVTLPARRSRMRRMRISRPVK